MFILSLASFRQCQSKVILLWLSSWRSGSLQEQGSRGRMSLLPSRSSSKTHADWRTIVGRQKSTAGKPWWRWMACDVKTYSGNFSHCKIWNICLRGRGEVAHITLYLSTWNYCVLIHQYCTSFPTQICTKMGRSKNHKKTTGHVKMPV